MDVLDESHLKGVKIMPTAKEREEKKALKLQAELERIENMCSYEKEYA